MGLPRGARDTGPGVKKMKDVSNEREDREARTHDEHAIEGVVEEWTKLTYGFINARSDGKTYFVHRSEIQGGQSLITGASVTFVPKESGRKPGRMQAINISGPGVSQEKSEGITGAARSKAQSKPPRRRHKHERGRSREKRGHHSSSRSRGREGRKRARR